MVLASPTSRNDYVGNGATSVYSFTFRILEDSDLRVTVRDTNGDENTLILNTDYTVTGAGSASGGSITLVDSGQSWLDGDGDLLTDYALTIRRVRPLTQETDIRNQGDFFPEIHEDAFDHQTMLNQQQQDEIDRAFKLPESISASDFDATLPATAPENPGAAVIINPTGTGLALGQGADNIEVPVTVAHGGTGSSAVLTGNKLMKSSSQTIVESDIGISGSKLTGLAAGSANGDSVRYEQVLKRAGDSMLGALDEAHGSDIASASTINLSTATGNLVDVTGTTTITAITLTEGAERTVRFTGILTLTHGASLVLPTGANITTAAGDYAIFRGYGSGVVRCVAYSRASGAPLVIGSAATADQADMEAASSTTKVVTPGRTQFHPGVAKAWVLFNGTGTVTISVSHNVSSITDNGTGDYTINFTTPFSGTSFICAGTLYGVDAPITPLVIFPLTRSVSSCQIGSVKTTDGLSKDASDVQLVFFGDQ